MTNVRSLRSLIIPPLPSIAKIQGVRSDLVPTWKMFDEKFEKWRQEFTAILQRQDQDLTIADLDYLKGQVTALQAQITLVRTELLKQIQNAAQSPDVAGILERLTLIEILISQILSIQEDIVYTSPGPTAFAVIQHDRPHEPQVIVIIGGEEWDAPVSYPDPTHVRVDINPPMQFTVVIKR